MLNLSKIVDDDLEPSHYYFHTRVDLKFKLYGDVNSFLSRDLRWNNLDHSIHNICKI